ncbi:meprin A subunit beta isoform X1 [Scophthalmus maximus]|uniref:meprin A subunit beta isoform X1 n=1 Tax=Scophthalmus maximus TaxID=52904 RepID=UPI000F30CF62|nr:meprin A subunit beta isoform X1 [Scophthalmus maximus]
MKGYILLVVVLAVSSALFLGPEEQDTEDFVDCGEAKNIDEINKVDTRHDDILEPQNTQNSVVIQDDFLWTSPVAYVLENDLELNAKGVILKAFDQFRLKTCIDFKQRDSEDYYISVQKLNGCFSYVGRLMSGQPVSIGKYCDEISTVEHEFLHALGFYHEQNRYDRDEHVTIAYENIQEGFVDNFIKVRSEESTTMGVPYDYWSVMHYGPNAFSNGNGSTIMTKDEQYQGVIGQRRDMSPWDVLELNRRYKCSSTVAFNMYCGFSESDCQMTRCSRKGNDWKRVTYAYGGPRSDHTSLPTGSTYGDQTIGYFMHASTAKGTEGDSAWLETKRMMPTRECHVQCLQFYYYHSGNESDILNIWIREFHDERDFTGTRRLMGQITGPQTSHWQIHHVSLNAKKDFQVEFEARKGAGKSSGGFSIDDINLSEIECPHVTIQFNDFEELLSSSSYNTVLNSPRQYSRGGYSYRVSVVLFKTFAGAFVQLLSGKNDDQLEWPCPYRQVTMHLVDQTPNIKMHMTMQRSFTTDPTTINSQGFNFWDDPRKIGNPFKDENNQTVYGGPRYGPKYFARLETLKSRSFLKGGSAVFTFTFEDLNLLINKSALPCPQIAPVKIAYPPKDLDSGPCSPRIPSTTRPPQTKTTPITALPKTTDDDSIFGFSPAMVASPVLTLLLALMLLIL